MRANVLLLFGAALAFLFSACGVTRCSEHLQKDCICAMIYDPVCGCNKKTYSNGCEARCHGIKEYHKGECK